jgi:hypothetical protein
MKCLVVKNQVCRNEGATSFQMFHFKKETCFICRKHVKFVWSTDVEITQNERAVEDEWIRSLD